MIKIAILGLGTVGTGVVKVVEANTAPIRHRLGEPLGVKTALVRTLRKGPYCHLMTDRFRDIETDSEIRVVVETIGGTGAAYEYTRRCLMAGKHVVTANKQLVAEHGCELLELARKNHVNYLFEASVGGGIPILHPLTQCMAANRVDEIYGILNGTTNFILTKMVRERMSFEEALKLAQEKGYAEADPTADVEGIDAGRKICILADLAFGHQVNPEKVPMEGITRLDLKDVELAGHHGYRIKLLGRCLRLEGNRRTAYVAPHLISADNPISDVNDVFNAIIVHGDYVDEVMFFGRGAGRRATASAVVGDVIEIARAIDAFVPAAGRAVVPAFNPVSRVARRRLLRVPAEAEPVMAMFAADWALKPCAGELAVMTAPLTDEEFDAQAASLSARGVIFSQPLVGSAD